MVISNGINTFEMFYFPLICSRNINNKIRSNNMKKLKYNSWGLLQQIKVCFGNFLLQLDVKGSKRTIQGGKDN